MEDLKITKFCKYVVEVTSSKFLHFFKILVKVTMLQIFLSILE